MQSGAILSPCKKYRYRLDRNVQMFGKVFAFFGINGSTADARLDDQTVKKWIGFTKRNGGSRFIVGNPFAFRSKHVRDLLKCEDPVGPENKIHLGKIIDDADVLIPCWGNRSKAPKGLRHHVDSLKAQLFKSGKPVKIFGLTKSGDPKHPLRLGYDTLLIPWNI